MPAGVCAASSGACAFSRRTKIERAAAEPRVMKQLCVNFDPTSIDHPAFGKGGKQAITSKLMR